MRFNFGTSYSFPSETVAHTIGKALPWTLVLVGVTTVCAFIIGTLLGVFAGWRRGTAVDTSVTLGATFFAAFPPFWLGLLLLYFLAFKYGWFPIKGGYAEGATPNLSPAFLGDAFRHSVLPALTLAITTLSGWVFGMRNNMINTLGEDYVTFAEANGLRSRTVALLYAARNALLPNVTAFGLSLGAVVGGSILVEGVFSYPGLGNLLYIAVTNHDFPLDAGAVPRHDGQHAGRDLRRRSALRPSRPEGAPRMTLITAVPPPEAPGDAALIPSAVRAGSSPGRCGSSAGPYARCGATARHGSG